MSGVGLCAVVLCWSLLAEPGRAGCGGYVVAAGESSMAEHAPRDSDEPVDFPPCQGPECRQGPPDGPEPVPLTVTNSGLGKACLVSVDIFTLSGLSEWVESPRFFSRGGFPGALLRPPRV